MNEVDEEWDNYPMIFFAHVKSIKENIKKIVPYNIKVNLQVLKNVVLDVVNGHYFYYAKKTNSTNAFLSSINLKQELKPNEAKINNLLRAINSIEQIQINPNEILSFWRVVGNPSKKNGFMESRSLVQGKIKNTVGGGLCQLSGLMYYISLSAKLDILERHNHSADIYTDETRFTPLGSDATVAYGYKDLKIRNNLNSPIRFNFTIEDQTIKIMIKHSSQIGHNVVEFVEHIKDDGTKEVTTIINNTVYNHSTYKVLSST